MSVLDLTTEVRPSAVRKLNYKRAYCYWYALLSNKVISLFDWQGLPFKQHELELRLQLFPAGYCGIIFSEKYDRYMAVKGEGTGVTEYPDKWLKFTFANPLVSGAYDINSVVIARNNSLLISSMPMVQHYAHLLAHNDLSLQAILINSRRTGYSVAKDDATKKRLESSYRSLEDGATEVIFTEEDLATPMGSKPIEYIVENPGSQGFNILDYWQLGQNVLKDFYTTIGISKPTDKRERLITDEIAQEQPLFKFNIEDMLDCRREICADLERVFGLSGVTVDIAESLQQAQRMTEGGFADENA